MKEFSITDLAKVTGAKIHASYSWDNIRSFTGISTDSRTTQAGDCFFAISGENFDGHDYIADALGKSAVCAVISKDIDEITFSGKCLLKVEDVVKALGKLAGEYRRQAGYKVVAITGSAGKTTTRQIIYHALSLRFSVHQSPKSFNNKIGVPLTLLGAGQDIQIVVAELGSNHPGEISHLTRTAEPDIALVTNVYPAHLEGFGDIETIIQEKLTIAEGLRKEGVLIVNGDFEQLLDACRARDLKFTTFGKSDDCEFQAGNIRPDGQSNRFTIDGTEVHLPLAGPGNIENATAAWAVCSKFGLTIEDFAHALETLSPVSMRTELLQIGTLTVLSDCYNANPASMKNALEILINLEPVGQRRKVFICGEMAELGEQTEHLHAELGREIARAGVQLMIAIGKPVKIAAEAAQENADNYLEIKYFENTVSAYNNLHELIKDYDIILVKGSRVAKLELLVEKLNELFSRSVSRQVRL